MRVSVRQDEHCGVIRVAVAGEVDLATSGYMTRSICEALAGHQVREVVVDLDEVSFIDATGVAGLVLARSLAAQRDVQVTVANAHHLVGIVLQLCGVSVTGP